MMRISSNSKGVVIKAAIIFSALLFIILPGICQESGYYKQTFEDTNFPPKDWQINNVQGVATWTQSTSEHHTGRASAYMIYQGAGGEDWLITPAFQVTKTTDSLTFWLMLDFQGYAPDSLSVKISATDTNTASFTKTLLKLEEGISYPGDAENWYPYKLSLETYVGQQIYIAFKHFNSDGDGIYIDDITLGTPEGKDIRAVSVNLESYIIPSAQTPSASFKNEGSETQSFDVTMQINPGGYTATKTITDLASGSSVNVDFNEWTPASGVYTVKVFSQLTDDGDPSNDTITKDIHVLNALTNNGWSSQSDLLSGRWATAPVFSNLCIASDDPGYIFLIGGAKSDLSNSNSNARYNIADSTWTSMADLPTSRTQIAPVKVGSKIYVVGGYVSPSNPTLKTEIYDIATDTWSDGADMPTAVGDYGIGVYADSLIYVIGGNSLVGDENIVQIYHVNTNSWTTGTPKPGDAVASGRMGISGNKIVFVGGYSQELSNAIANSYLGVIDASVPETITWAAIDDYPGGTVSHHASGVAFENNDKVYFSAGDPNGLAETVNSSLFAYNVAKGSWEYGPAMITGVSYSLGLVGIIKDETLYMAIMGGYDGEGIVSKHEWLELGKAQSVPSVQADTTICAGASFVLKAYNSSSYVWAADESLSNTTISNPIATPTETTTYAVTMAKRNGCTVTKEVTVTVTTPIKPTISISHDNGETILTSSASTGNQWYLNGGVIAGATGSTYTADEPGLYSVKITTGGCDATAEPVSVVITAIAPDEKNNALFVSPSPADNVISINLWKAAERKITIEVLSVDGKVMHQETVAKEQTEVVINHYPTGVYLVKATAGDRQQSVRFMKK
jgi:N-acetylneuraminic acid mutarotase